MLLLSISVPEPIMITNTNYRRPGCIAPWEHERGLTLAVLIRHRVLYAFFGVPRIIVTRSVELCVYVRAASEENLCETSGVRGRVCNMIDTHAHQPTGAGNT